MKNSLMKSTLISSFERSRSATLPLTVGKLAALNMMATSSDGLANGHYAIADLF